MITPSIFRKITFAQSTQGSILSVENEFKKLKKGNPEFSNLLIFHAKTRPRHGSRGV